MDKKYRTTFIDLNKFPMHKRPYSDSNLMNMPKRKLVDYIRDIEHNYEILHEFYQNSIKYGEDLQAKLKKEIDRTLEEEVKFEDRKQQTTGLISKKEAMSRIESQYNQWGDAYDVHQILGDLEDMKPVDAIPIRHGKWVCYPECLRYESAYCSEDIVCSACGEAFNIVDNDTERFSYCPHCGAKMDAKQEIANETD